MLEMLRAWLNGSREYFTGVILYSKVGDNTALLNLFRKGPTDYTRQRLQEELLRICQELKNHQHADTSGTGGRLPATQGENPLPSSPGPTHQSEGAPPVNPALYEVCRAEANKAYKEVMNLRAELFALGRADDLTDPNTPDKIASRARLAISVVQGYQKASQLYDQADYVREHGRLPHQPVEEEETDYEALPDHLVKPTLDNLRKNVNKMKKREQTPDRLALIQKHEAGIQKLLERWHSLKPAQ